MSQFHAADKTDPESSADSKSGQDWFLTGQINDQEPSRRFTINTSPFLVGRQSDSNLRLPIGCVSKRHAEFTITPDGQLLLRELGSTNGTFVNGEKIRGEIEIFESDLIHFASIVFRVGCLRSQQLTNNTIEEDVCDQALALVQFERLISDGGLLPYFQPLVKLTDRERIGFEVLGRSRLFGLQTPQEMFQAASQLNLESQLSETFRSIGIQQGSSFGPDVNLFLNTHPIELDRPELYRSLKHLREMAPDQKITLEIHEAASTNMPMMRELCAVLEDLDMMLAFDDFGVGKARLIELGEVRPDFLKFDMKLTKDIESAPKKRQELVALFCNLVNNLGIQTLAEGVETEECHQVLLQMGFQLGQGFLYGRPAPLKKYLDPANNKNSNNLRIREAELDSANEI